MFREPNQSAAPPSYRALSMAVRPMRLAVLIPEMDDWPHFAMRAIEIFSQMWGGAQNILIPCSQEGQIPDLFWPLLRAFDPDIVAHYHITLRDMQFASPKNFEKWSQGQLEKAARGGKEDIESLQRLFDSDSFLDSPWGNWAPSEETNKRMESELSVDPMFGPPSELFSAAGPNRFGFSLAESILGYRDSGCVILQGDELPLHAQLMIQDRIGSFPKEHVDLLRKSGMNVSCLDVTETHIEQIAEVCCLGYAEPRNRAASRRFLEHLGERAKEEPKWSGAVLSHMFPLYKSTIKCQWRRHFSKESFTAPLVVVVGDSLQDYCLGMALRRLTGMAIWVPSTVSGNKKASHSFWLRLLQEIASLERHSNARTETWLTSASIVLDELGAFVSPCQSELPLSLLPNLAIKEHRGIKLPPSQRLFHETLNNMLRYEPFVGDTMVARLETPIPTDCVTSDVDAVSWFVDVHVVGHQLPADARLGHLVEKSKKDSGQRVRCSSAGVSYFSHGVGIRFASLRIDEVVQRPQLRCPDALEVFRYLLEVSGGEARISSAGQYERACLDIFGGLEELHAVFANKARNGVLEAFRSKADSDERPGVFLKGLDRRFLTITDIQRAASIESAVEARELIDDWIRRSVLSRGLILQCEQCSHSAWYHLEVLGSAFLCQRCRHANIIVQRSWKKPTEEPCWYYDLAEVVYQFVNHNGIAPIIALHKLSENTRSFLFTPELQIQLDDDIQVEIDLWAIADGQIIIGEANTTGVLSENAGGERKKLEKLRRVVELVSASRFVVATTAPNWRAGTRSRLDEAFSDCRTKPEFLEGLE